MKGHRAFDWLAYKQAVHVTGRDPLLTPAQRAAVRSWGRPAAPAKVAKRPARATLRGVANVLALVGLVLVGGYCFGSLLSAVCGPMLRRAAGVY